MDARGQPGRERPQPALHRRAVHAERTPTRRVGRRLSRREHIAPSVHTRNGPRTATADAELAMLAGAERVRAAFGNGERSGNVIRHA
jgi:hypothetical protein